MNPVIDPAPIVAPAIAIIRWAFWSAETEDPEAWMAHWTDETAMPGVGLPAAAAVPAMHRRRLSKLSKMAVQLALECSEGQQIDYTIFGSRHGEVVRTSGMLDAIAAAETLSPTQFSQSVHNTSSGLYAILNEDRGPATSIAAGAATFAACWTEAAAEMVRHPQRTALLVCADEVLPPKYAATLSERQCDYGLAAVLRLDDGSGRGVRLETLMADHPAPEQAADRLPMGPRMLAWFLAKEPELHQYAEGECYRWSRS